MLPKYLPENHYKLFLCLSISIRILCTNSSERNICYADSLLKYFVEEFKLLYRKHNVSYNVHGLLHLADDVRYFGNLDLFSAFKFESKLGDIKRFIRKSSLTLSQLHHRLYEQDQISHEARSSEKIIIMGKLNPDNTYQNIKCDTFLIAPTIKNGIFQVRTGDVVQVKNITQSSNNDNIVLEGQIIFITDEFSSPCLSSKLGIYTSNLNEIISDTICLSISDIKSKCVCMPKSRDSYIVFPLLHTQPKK